MKRITILSLILCSSFLSAAWAQQEPNTPRTGLGPPHRYGALSGSARPNRTSTQADLSVQSKATHISKTWYLDNYPGLIWSSAGNINDAGVVVLNGDLSPSGTRHLFSIRLLGPHAPQWFGVGSINSNQEWLARPWISETGLIVDYAAVAEIDPETGEQYVHAFAWAPKSEGVDLGAPSDIGFDSYKNSAAVTVNRWGTLIGGGGEDPMSGAMVPAVWTPTIAGHKTTWKIHKLDTPEGFPYGFVLGVNDFGQVGGTAYDDAGVQIPILWNPLPGGEGWETIQLPLSPDHPGLAICCEINDKGELVGAAWDLSYQGPAGLWRPIDYRRRTYELTELPHIEGLPLADFAEAINESGDIVGGITDQDWNYKAARWSTKNLTLVKPLDFPATWSFASGVNNLGIAVVIYGGGNCDNECSAALQFRNDQHDQR